MCRRSHFPFRPVPKTSATEAGAPGRVTTDRRCRASFSPDDASGVWRGSWERGAAIMLVVAGVREGGPVDQSSTDLEWNSALVGLYRSHRLPLLRLAVLLTDDPG